MCRARRTTCCTASRNWTGPDADGDYSDWPARLPSPHGRRPPGCTPLTQCLVDRVGVERRRVELTADPLEHVLVRRLVGVPDRLQEVAVAPRPATVLGRA